MKKKKLQLNSLIIRGIYVIAILAIWEYIARSGMLGSRSALIFPSLEQITHAFIRNFTKGYAGTSIIVYVANSMKILLIGLGIGILLAFIFSGLSMVSSNFFKIYDFTVSMCDLLPGIALLPIVIIVFGARNEVIVFLVVHAVLWPMSRNMLDGFSATPRIYVEAGKNMGLSGIQLIWGVYLPAASSYILSGLKSGWARAWRGLISAEMIFGIASSPGIGLFINQMRTNMNNAEMYATLIVIIIIGMVVQYGILKPIEVNTVMKWGMIK